MTMLNDGDDRESNGSVDSDMIVAVAAFRAEGWLYSQSPESVIGAKGATAPAAERVCREFTAPDKKVALEHLETDRVSPSIREHGLSSPLSWQNALIQKLPMELAFPELLELQKSYTWKKLIDANTGFPMTLSEAQHDTKPIKLTEADFKKLGPQVEEILRKEKFTDMTITPLKEGFHISLTRGHTKSYPIGVVNGARSFLNADEQLAFDVYAGKGKDGKSDGTISFENIKGLSKYERAVPSSTTPLTGHVSILPRSNFQVDSIALSPADAGSRTAMRFEVSAYKDERSRPLARRQPGYRGTKVTETESTLLDSAQFLLKRLTDLQQGQ